MWSLTPYELYLPSVALYPVCVCIQSVEHVCTSERAQMCASVRSCSDHDDSQLSGQTYMTFCFTLWTECSHSFVGVCMLAFKHNSSWSDKGGKMTSAFQHTQTTVLEAETNQECKEIRFFFFLTRGNTLGKVSVLYRLEVQYVALQWEPRKQITLFQ